MYNKTVSWNNLHSYTQKEIRTGYKLNDRQLELAVREHLDGANQKERRDFYQQFYSRRK